MTHTPKPIAGATHLHKVAIDDPETITTTLIHNNILYEITFTPPSSTDAAAYFKYKDGSEADIKRRVKDLALSVLSHNPSKDTEVKATFAIDASNHVEIELSHKKITDKTFSKHTLAESEIDKIKTAATQCFNNLIGSGSTMIGLKPRLHASPSSISSRLPAPITGGHGSLSPLQLLHAPKAILNPSCNCFMNATLQMLLHHEPIYTYTQDALTRIINKKPDNPTMQGLPADFELTDCLPEERAFITLSPSSAADTAKRLLTQWHEKRTAQDTANDGLSAKESSELRVCLIKLMNHRPGAGGLIPHIGNGSLNIAPNKQEDAAEFASVLIQGLGELASKPWPYTLGSLHTSLENPSDAPMRRLKIEGSPGSTHVDLSTISGDPLSLNSIDVSESGVKKTGFSVNFTDPNQLTVMTADKRDYQLESFVVHSGSTLHSGHYWSYQRCIEHGNVFWVRCDDLRDPSVSLANTQDIKAIFEGKTGNITPTLLTFKKL